MPFGACDVEQKIRGDRNETRNGILFYSDQDIKPESPEKMSPFPFLIFYDYNLLINITIRLKTEMYGAKFVV